MRIQALIMPILIAPLFTACGNTGGNDDLMAAEQALDATGTARVESALAAVALDGVTVTMTAEEAARHAADAAGFSFQVPACVTTDTQGSTTTYTFEDCTGAYGLVNLSGDLEVAFTIRPQEIEISLTGEVTANQTTVTLDADIKLLETGPAEQLTVQTRSSALGVFGHLLEQSGGFTATFDEESGCITLDGSWTVRIGARDWTLAITSFEQCPGACPSAGGSITFEAGFRDWTVSISFDGTNKATWTAGDKSGTVFLPCND